MDQVQSSALKKNLEKYVQFKTFLSPLFSDKVNEEVGMVVCIPAFAENDLLHSLQSLKNAQLPKVKVEVIVVINHPENASIELKEENNQIYIRAHQWAKNNSSDSLKFLVSAPVELPKKHAGAGLARKIAMDEAVGRLQYSQVENPTIVCFDADSVVETNYFNAIYQSFTQHPNWLAASINFEHPLGDPKRAVFNDLAIIQYELHLRYYQAGLVFAGHPQAIFTVGSSMAVTRNAYVQQGGMNRRKAGEDFWFMQKLIMAGEVGFIGETTVYPSSRHSFRVPFGTGRAISEMNEKNTPIFYTSAFNSFERLKQLLEKVPEFYEGNFSVEDAVTQQFLDSQNFKLSMLEIKEYTTSFAAFYKRFYRWMNLFMVMKFFHFVRDQNVPDAPVFKEGLKLLAHMTEEKFTTDRELLLHFRAKKKVKPSDFTFPL